MSKLYLLLLCVFATFSLQAQTCTNVSENFGTALVSTLDGQMFDAGTTAEVCGTTDAFPVAFVYASGEGAIASAILYQRINGNFVEVNQLVEGQLLFLNGATGYSLVLTFDEPVEDTDFTFSYAAQGNNVAATGTVIGVGLPVDLAAFTGRSLAKSVLLDWSTASESGNEGFDVERSADGVNWSAIDFIPAAAEAQNGADYSFEDASPIPGQSFYRLKQLDFDGKFAYSPIVTLQRANGNDLVVFPNPAFESINVRFADGNASHRAIITDQVGRVVLQRTVSSSDALDLSDLGRGVYQVSIATENGMVTKRFMKN